MAKLTCQGDLNEAFERLVQLDGRLSPHLANSTDITLRHYPAGLAGLLRIIIGQQVSVASARAIWQRFEAGFPDCKGLEEAGEDDLRACGLSAPKIRTVMRIVGAIRDGFDIDGLAAMDPGAARKALLSLHGVGPWTADIYLLFCLGEQDIFPAGDLALQVAAQHLLGLKERPSEKTMAELAQTHWSPERSAAAHLLWAIYRQLKQGREGVL